MEKTVKVLTLGCKANTFDSQKLESSFFDSGWSFSEENPSLILVNSCAVTNEATRQSYQLIKKMKKKYPDAKIAFTGCAAEVNPSEALLKTADYVIGNQDKDNLVSLLEKKGDSAGVVLGAVSDYASFLSVHPMDREWPAVNPAFFLNKDLKQTRTTRAFLKIQEGCNAFCTYCIIPYGRGPSRSLSIDQVIESIQRCVDQNILEVVLTGTNIGEYGYDFSHESSSKKQFLIEDLVQAILDRTNVQRLRLSSLNPAEITDRLIEQVKTSSRMCKHFHVSLQHPLGKILRLMKRRYSAQQVVDTLCVLDQIPDVFVGMDVITGFPGETQEDFEQSVQVLSSLPWTRLHVFPYSERAGTPATRLSFSVPQEKRLERSRILNALSLERQKKVYQQKLSSFGSRSVLLERFSGKKSDSRLSGLDNAYYRYVFSGDSPLSSRMGEPGHIVQASAYDLVIDSARFEVAFLARIKK